MQRAGDISVLLKVHSRHDERLLAGLSQHAIHEQWRVGEAVLVPQPSFVEAQPVNTNSISLGTTADPPTVCTS